jgi:4-carboxymuconolactone decarboxylase
MSGTVNDALGGRLPLREPATIMGAQRAMYDSIMEEYAPWGKRAGFKMVTADGRLIGPFNAFLLNPQITRALLAFDATLKKHVSFSERVREVIILAVGGVWKSQYELYSHSIMGRNAGLSAAAISSLSTGDLPKDLAPDELLAARIAHDMAKSYGISDSLFAEAEKTFGKQGLYEIGALVGEFSLTCTILNLFDIPAPSPEV